MPSDIFELAAYAYRKRCLNAVISAGRCRLSLPGTGPKSLKIWHQAVMSSLHYPTALETILCPAGKVTFDAATGSLLQFAHGRTSIPGPYNLTSPEYR